MTREIQMSDFYTRPVEMSDFYPPQRRTERRLLKQLAPYAKKALERYGELSTPRLIEKMLEGGWVGGGNPRDDYNNVYNCMAANKNFVNRGRGIWAIRDEGK